MLMYLVKDMHLCSLLVGLTAAKEMQEVAVRPEAYSAAYATRWRPGADLACQVHPDEVDRGMHAHVRQVVARSATAGGRLAGALLEVDRSYPPV